MVIFAGFIAFLVLHVVHGIIVGAIRDSESPFSRSFWLS